MADKKISELAAVTDVVSGDEYVLGRSGASKKIDADDLAAGIAALYPPTSHGAELDYAQITSNVTIAGASAAAATTVISGGSVSYDGSTRVIVEAFMALVIPAGSTTNVVTLWEDTTDMGAWAQMNGAAFPVGTLRWLLTPSAGSHAYTLKAWTTGASGTLYAGSSYAPAYLRVTTA